MFMFMELPTYYSILWDPGYGRYQFYDHTFHTDPDILLKRVETEFNTDLFSDVFVAKVTFTKIGM